MKELKDLHIVIAEDDLDDGEIVADIFRKHPSFTKVTWVKHGKELLDFLANESARPDIILTDINMPIINGIEALEAINLNKSLNTIPVFIYSSTSNPAYELKAKELGSLAFITKPYNLNDFDDIPDRLLYVLATKVQAR